MLVEYWKQFKDNFQSELEATLPDTFNQAWKSSDSRTTFYREYLLPKVAVRMNLKRCNELFKVDYAFCKSDSFGNQVPLVFIESENNAFSATHEVRKLCSLAAPLKVLITCVEWSDEPGEWPNGGHRTNLMKNWANIISGHSQIWPQPCVYGVIVAERWKKRLRYYSEGLSSSGASVDAHGVLFEREES
ncbi:MAG: hypothetical protein FWF20_11915 [Betaproteobacteria bacterium]|nr:hypothetical protein [Betaproteobacteria bacterium]MCL2887454.1 hypothetical protein [Betaproteobacteria bacterium]